MDFLPSRLTGQKIPPLFPALLSGLILSLRNVELKNELARTRAAAAEAAEAGAAAAAGRARGEERDEIEVGVRALLEAPQRGAKPVPARIAEFFEARRRAETEKASGGELAPVAPAAAAPRREPVKLV